ncbi:DUF4440 domain-containing protein [Mesoterricola sediminis]|uniref:Uncharacterized protein n=1 Tax=Mesoterricola sediminis TaxID=2927980 RepID=A0AA48H9C6_9BACT|nr:DUF4440 domain-containing protein [Mesoterricola sediminis]BDU78313.1 hypothetical protein METESE_32710 [Mesoterricola sediminis]
MRAAAAAVLLVLAACGRETPEAQVRRAFDRAVAAVERGDAAGAAEALSPAFSGPEGLDRASARLFLAARLRGSRIGVTVLGSRIQVEGREAVQTVDVLLTGRGSGELLPGESSRRTFVLRWEAREGTWRLRELV